MGLRPTHGDENHRRRSRVKLALSLPKGGGLAEELHADRLIVKRLSFGVRQLTGEPAAAGPQLSFAPG
jgi:hypothetical protein